jgi:hypothetical protein
MRHVLAVSTGMSWNGIRVTLGCGHMDLRDLPKTEDKKREWVIGGVAGCRICPTIERPTGGRVTGVRTIVNVEPVTAPRRPERLRPLEGESS